MFAFAQKQHTLDYYNYLTYSMNNNTILHVKQSIGKFNFRHVFIAIYTVVGISSMRYIAVHTHYIYLLSEPMYYIHCDMELCSYSHPTLGIVH